MPTAGPGRFHVYVSWWGSGAQSSWRPTDVRIIEYKNHLIVFSAQSIVNSTGSVIKDFISPDMKRNY